MRKFLLCLMLLPAMSCEKFQPDGMAGSGVVYEKELRTNECFIKYRVASYMAVQEHYSWVPCSPAVEAEIAKAKAAAAAK